MATPGYDRTYNLGLTYSSDAGQNRNLDRLDQALGGAVSGGSDAFAALETRIADLEARVAVLEAKPGPP